MTSEPRDRWVRPIPYGTSEETSVVLDHASHEDFAAWDLGACIPIKDWPSDATMTCMELEGRRTPDDVVPNHLGLVVVSGRCRDAILKVHGAGECVQFLPVRLDYRGKDLGVFYVVNILTAVPALDRVRSRYDVYTALDVAPQPMGSIKTLRQLVLLPGLLKPTIPMFRLKEELAWVLFSPELKAALDSAGVTGFAWIDVSLTSDFDE